MPHSSSSGSSGASGSNQEVVFSARFRCLNGCDGRLPLDEPHYACPSCGGLLEVEHDLAALKTFDGPTWKKRFDDRATSGQARAGGSGVWAKHEWVMPNVRRDQIVTLGEGGTPLDPARLFGAHLGVGQLYLKQCGQSPTGSFKDLGMTVLTSMVHQMRSDGKHVRAVACASTGDTSAALAAYCARVGLPAIVLLPRGKVSTAQLLQPIAHGARVFELDTDFDGCMALVDRLSREDGVYLANSKNALRLEGQKTVALELVQQLGWHVPDWIVIPGGNLGNVSALAAGLDMIFELGLVTGRKPRLVVAQAEHANPLYRAFHNDWKWEPQPAQTTLASAIQIGNPVSFERAKRALIKYNGLVEQASEAELADVAALADRAGHFVCPHTAVALAAVRTLAHRKTITKNDDVVVISTANGLKFTDWKVRYHQDELPGIAALHRNPPVQVAADFDALRKAIDTAPPA